MTGQRPLASDAAGCATLETDYEPGFDGEASATLNYAESGSFGVDGLFIHKERVISADEMNHERTEDGLAFDLHPHTRDELADGSCLDDPHQISSNWQEDRRGGSGTEETFHDQTYDNGENTTEWGSEMMSAREIEDDIEDRCAWNDDQQDFISSQTDSWLQQSRLPDQDLEQHQHNTAVEESLKMEMEMAKPEEPSGYNFYVQEERIDNSTHHDPRPDGYWNKDCQTFADVALPTSTIDVVHVEDRGHQTMYNGDDGQVRIVGRRRENMCGSGTVNTIQTSGSSMTRDHETDQLAAEQDTLPRRGHTKNLLAQWRELEQRRKDEELIERAAATSSARSRRTAVRTTWINAPHTEQQRGVAATRSQSCGPVSRRSTKVKEFDSPSSRRNSSVDDGEESEMSFDRVAIKAKFERLDADAQRTTIFNRKKVGRQQHCFSQKKLCNSMKISADIAYSSMNAPL